MNAEGFFSVFCLLSSFFLYIFSGEFCTFSKLDNVLPNPLESNLPKFKVSLLVYKMLHGILTTIPAIISPERKNKGNKWR
jgi:hypothetical protein